MRSRDRILALLAVLAVIGVFKMAQQLYRYYAFGEERAEIVRLEVEIEEAGYGVIRTQVHADTLRGAIERADDELRRERVELDRLERQLLRSPIPRSVEAEYRTRLGDYNARVNVRNGLAADLRDVVDRNHGYVERYNLLVDSIRRLATVIGEPYYPVLSPAEIAVRREAASPNP